MNSKKLSIGNFDKVSDFESKILIRVKFKLNFANNFRFRANSCTTHQFSKTVCFFRKSDFEEIGFRKFYFWSFLQQKTDKLAVVFCFTEWIWEKKLEWQTVFEHNFSLRVGLPTNIFTTRQFLNENFYNVSDVESKILQNIRFPSRIVFL